MPNIKALLQGVKTVDLFVCMTLVSEPTWAHLDVLLGAYYFPTEQAFGKSLNLE